MFLRVSSDVSNASQKEFSVTVISVSGQVVSANLMTIYRKVYKLYTVTP